MSNMKEIPAKEIMMHWNNAHPENPLSLEDVKEYLETHAFFNLPLSVVIKIMEQDVMI